MGSLWGKGYQNVGLKRYYLLIVGLNFKEVGDYIGVEFKEMSDCTNYGFKEGGVVLKIKMVIVPIVGLNR